MEAPALGEVGADLLGVLHFGPLVEDPLFHVLALVVVAGAFLVIGGRLGLTHGPPGGGEVGVSALLNGVLQDSTTAFELTFGFLALLLLELLGGEDQRLGLPSRVVPGGGVVPGGIVGGEVGGQLFVEFVGTLGVPLVLGRQRVLVLRLGSRIGGEMKD